MEKQYKFSPNHIASFKRKTLLLTIIFLLVFVLGSFAIIQYTVAQPLSGNSLFFSIALLLGSMGFGLIRAYKKQLNTWASYKLIMDDNSLTRKRDNTPTIQIPFNEITQIIQTKSKNIIIKGQKANDTIYLLRSEYLENHEELVENLRAIMPFSNNPQLTLLERFAWTLPILMIASMLSLFLTQNKVIAVLATIALIALVIFCFNILQKSKEVDDHLKKNNWALIFVIPLIIGMLWYKFSH